MLIRLVELGAGWTYKTEGMLLHRFLSDGEADFTDFELACRGGGTPEAFRFLAGLVLRSEDERRLLIRVHEAGPDAEAVLEATDWWISSTTMGEKAVVVGVGLAEVWRRGQSFMSGG